jgi:hypothetical protein
MKRKLMGKAVGSGCEGGGYGARTLTLLFIMKAVWRVIPQAKIVMALDGGDGRFFQERNAVVA